MFADIHKDLINLFYPRICAACRSVLVKHENYICIGCLYNLPKTNFHLDRDNSMAELFWGRVNIESAAAYYYFERGSKCRKILHQIKYRGNKELAYFLGSLYGNELYRAGSLSVPELIIPVPLHPKRLKKRGFNQSEWFARGVATGLKKPVRTDIIQRIAGIETQTRKSRTERWENVENSFSVVNPSEIENKHLMLVDDVVTTGATLESCASVLLEKGGMSISILTLAFA